MFVLGYFLIGIANVLHVVIYAYIFILIINSILSFINPGLYNPAKSFINALSDFALKPIRKVIKPVGNVDLSPFIAMLILIFADSFLVAVLARFGASLI